MEFKQHHIEYKKTARFITFGNPETATELLIALHGYGQLATEWIENFNYLDPEKYFVVCPEGPHRYYQRGRRGQVVANWMTTEDRLVDIKNYVAYLNTVYENVTTNYQFDRHVLLGFSQGGATASRWMELGKHKFQLFILWGSVFPPDMQQQFDSPLDTSKNYFVVGNNDEYFDQKRISKHYKFLNEVGMNFELINFDGNHNIHKETLLDILKR